MDNWLKTGRLSGAKNIVRGTSSTSSTETLPSGHDEFQEHALHCSSVSKNTRILELQ